jgi:hypothetical protein
MAPLTPSAMAARSQPGSVEMPAKNEAHASGVSWGAVLAGAAVTAAFSLALLTLGTGIGLSALSPWANVGASASAVGWAAIGWLVVMQLIASSMGGYVAGRLRTKWVNVHTHEVYFRDTAHGLLVWAVALVITAAFLTSAAASVVGETERAGAAAANASVAGPSADRIDPNGYIVETLLRPVTPYGADRDLAAARQEVGLILANDLRDGSLAPVDRSYLAQIVVAKTGAGQTEAERRVDDAFARAVQRAERARKAVAHSMYWTFLALLVGAFCASVAATIGGKQRDQVVVV